MCVKCEFESSCLDAYSKASQFCNNNKQDNIETEAKKLFKRFFNNPYPSLHIVLVMWKSPLGTLEHRSGVFQEYEEAELFAKSLEEQYRASGMKYAVYINGNMFTTDK